MVLLANIIEIGEPVYAIAPVIVAGLISAAVKGVSAISKHVKGKRYEKSGEKMMDENLKAIKYSRPDEYGQIMNVLGQRSGRLKTQEGMVEDNVRRSTAAGVSSISQLADSPVAALGAYGGLKEQEQNAIADLGVQFEGMQDQALMDQTKGLQMGAGYSEKEQYYNSIYKNMVKANLGASKMSGGKNMAAEGMEGVASAGLDLVGTKYLSDTMNPKDPSGVDPGNMTSTDPTPQDGGSLANI